MHWIALILCASAGACGGGPFINLGFEQANLMGDWIPGWQLFLGTNSGRFALVYDLCPPDIGSSFATLVDATPHPDCPGGAIDGNYAFVLSQFPGPTMKLTQTGDIPAQARLLNYKFLNQGMRVSMNKQELDPIGFPGGVPISVPTLPPGNVDYDISRFAGQTVEFELTAPALAGQGGGYVDRIVFVLPLPVSRPQVLTNGQFQLTITGTTSGRSVDVQTSVDLIAWSSVGQVIASSNVVDFIDPSATNTSRRFYRARETLN